MREIKVENRKMQRRRCVKPASVMRIKTGDKRVVRIQKRDGSFVDEERDIEEESFARAIFIDEEVVKTFHIVHDGTEPHEFTSRKAAENFARALDGEVE